VLPGSYPINISGVSGAITRNSAIELIVQNLAPTPPTLTAPATAATAVSQTPTLTWAAAPQTSSYLVELATNASFTNVIAQQVVTGTSFTPSATLLSSTNYFWRVSARNACPSLAPPSVIFRDGFEDPQGGSATSSVFSFTTQIGPGDCTSGTPTTVFFDDMENGAPLWTHSAAVGVDSWALSTAFPASGLNAYRGISPVTQADQRLVSPAIVVPSGANQRLLRFSQRVAMEPNGANCYDAGILEVSTDGGTTFNQITAGITGLPYTGTVDAGNNALGGRPGWCNTTPHTVTAVDLAPYGGQTVQFRFRLGSDTGTGVADGWNIDDVRVLSCTP
jgi:lysyl endopeptidase